MSGIYWSNFQAQSRVCCWYNSPDYMYPLHGYSGAQIRLSVDGASNFASGISK